MKNWYKILFSIALSFISVFLCVGFAAISDNLKISGTADFIQPKPPGIYISNVEVYSYNGLEPLSELIVLPTNLQSSCQVNSQNARVTYKITVHNQSDMTYWYLGTQYVAEVENNGVINRTGGIVISTKDSAANSSDNFNTSDWVPPQAERTFYATYTFGANAQGTMATLVNFNFGLNMVSVSDEFLKVLNDVTSEYGYYYLADAFDKQYKENGNTVIGNVGADEDVFNNLFGSSLTLNIDGNELPVTILIERIDVDGNKNTGDSYDANSAPVGCEYTVYITVDNLNSGSGSTATVYAVSYTCSADGSWYMIGELYEGTCSIEDYDHTTDKFEGAFDVDSWRATPKEYTVIDGVTYKVGYLYEGTEYDKYNTIEQLMSKFDQELYNKVNNNSQTLLKAVCTTLYTYRHNNGRYDEYENAANIANPGYAELKAAFDRLKPYCYIGNGAQEVKIQNANSLSRAELIQMLEAIQKTYDYYLTVNS